MISSLTKQQRVLLRLAMVINLFCIIIFFAQQMFFASPNLNLRYDQLFNSDVLFILVFVQTLTYFAIYILEYRSWISLAFLPVAFILALATNVLYAIGITVVATIGLMIMYGDFTRLADVFMVAPYYFGLVVFLIYLFFEISNILKTILRNPVA